MAQWNSTFPKWTRYHLTVFFTIIAISLAGCGKNGSNNPAGPDPDPDPDPDPGNTDTNIVQTLQEHDDLSVLYQAIVDAGLESSLEAEGPFTVLAPVNSAFDNLDEGFIDGLSQDQLKNLINYHIMTSRIASSDLGEDESIQTVQESSIFVRAANGNVEFNRGALHGGSAVTEADIETSNGIIHKIDAVLLPDIFLDVLEIADKRYNLSKFVCECTSGRTQLDTVLTKTDSEFTVFIPTDDAFSESNVDALSDEELRDILEYHIIEEKFLSGDLSDGQTLTTLNSSELTVSVAGDGTITLNGGAATVQETDLEGINGVVYIINSVLSPPE